MHRRRQPALIASLATAAVASLVAPAVAAGVLVQGASAASLAASAGVVAPAVAAGAVVAEAASTVATVAGEATSEAAVEPAAETVIVEEEEVAEPAEEPAGEPPTEPAPTTTTPATDVIDPTTTTTPDEEPAGEEPVGEPPTEPAPTTTTPATDVIDPTTTTTPDEEPVGDSPTEPTPTTITPAPVCDPTTETVTTTGPTTTTEPTSPATTPAPADEPVCEPATPTTTAPDEETEPTSTTAPTDAPDQEPADEEPAVGPTTEPTVPTTVPTPVDEPVEGSVDDGATIPPSDDEPSDVATADENDQPADEADDGEPPETVDPPDDPATPIDTTPAELNTYDPGLRASSYDGVYAEGVPVGVAMATTRWLESGNRYDAQARGSTASGAYQVLDSTWRGYGGYPRAVFAPPEVQDQFAYESFTALLKRHGNDVSTIPVSWYIGHVPRGAEWDTVPHPEAGNKLTPRQYQAKWMKKFFSLLSEGAPVYLPSDSEALIPAIAFPVLGPVEFVDDWHFERDGGARRHEGLDLLGYEGQPLRAAFDGVITEIDDDPSGIAGNGLRLTRDDGLYANYFHLSNSETGPVHSSLEVGTRVRAGQIIGFMGSTGNAGIPHLHFEIRTAEREPMAPYPAILEAVQREQCAVGLGPWSTEFVSPLEQTQAVAAALQALADLTDEQVDGLVGLTDAEAAALEAFVDLTDEQVDGLTDAEAATLDSLARLTDDQVVRLLDLAEDADDEVEHVTIDGPDGAQWVIGTDGSVTASGEAAMIGTYQADCPMPIDIIDQDGDPIMYGTDADGLPVDELPIGWWDDEAVEWTPVLDDEADDVDPWELDQADLDVAHENHVDDAESDDQLADRRSLNVM